MGHENYDYRDNYLTGSRSQQILDGNIELVNFTTTTNLNSGADFARQEGYFSRLNYDYNNKYFLTFSARRDGSSRFYQDVRWGNFFGASAAWQLHSENFLKDSKIINNLKLRASQSINQRISIIGIKSVVLLDGSLPIFFRLF